VVAQRYVYTAPLRVIAGRTGENLEALLHWLKTYDESLVAELAKETAIFPIVCSNIEDAVYVENAK
jgi:hypothetical protein